MSEEIYLEKKTGYAIMTINRPKQMNALNTGIVEQIDKLLDEVEADPSIRCLIITGAGEKSFIAGADIGQMGTPGYQPADAHYLMHGLPCRRSRWASFPVGAVRSVCRASSAKAAQRT